MLANWRSDQLRDDPNLVCDSRNPWDQPKYPYDFTTKEILCERMRSPNPPLPAVNLPANLRGVNKLSDSRVCKICSLCLFNFGYPAK